MWRDGATLVLTRDATFPPRCIKCNAVAVDGGQACKLSWTPPAVQFLHLFIVLTPWSPAFFLTPLVVALIAMLAREKAEVEVRLCERHDRRIVLARSITRGGSVIFWLLFFYTFASLLNFPVPYRLADWMHVLVFACAIPWAIAASLLGRLVSARGISADEVRLRGCGEAFLAALPSILTRK